AAAREAAGARAAAAAREGLETPGNEGGRGFAEPATGDTSSGEHRLQRGEKAMGTSGIGGGNKKRLMLFSGRAFPELAEEIGEVLGTAPTPTDAYDFANGEIFIRYRESVRGSDAFVVQSIAQPVNHWLMESLIMVDALKRGSAKRITVVLP